MRRAILLAGLATSFPVARTAVACSWSHYWPRYLRPASGTALPPDPHLLLLDSGTSSGITVRVDGSPTRYSAARLGDDAWLLRVESGRGRVLTMTVSGREYRYSIEPRWRRATSHIAGVARLESSCTPTDAIGIAVETNAIGFRADWRGDHPGSAWLPTVHRLSRGPNGGPGIMFADGSRGAEPAPSPRLALIEMGHHGDHWNVPRDLYEKGGAVSLTAIHADGSSEYVGRIDLASDVAVPLWGKITDITPPGAREWEPTVERHRRSDPRPLFGLSIAGALIALLLWRRDRPTLAG